MNTDLSKRNFLKVGSVAAISTLTLGTGACGPSKEKAVRVAGFVIDLSKEAVPLLDLLGGHDIAELMRAKVIPALEKMKEALSNADIPTSQSALETVRNVLSGVETALLNLPESARRTTIIGILASARVLLLTVEAFIDSEMPAAAVAKNGAMRTARTKKSTDETIRRVFDAVRQ